MPLWDEVGNSFPSCDRILIRGGIDGLPAGSTSVVHDATLIGDGTPAAPLGVQEALTLGTLTGFGSLTIARDTWLGSAVSLVSKATNVLSSRSIISFRDSLNAVKWNIDSDFNGARTFRLRDDVGARNVFLFNQLGVGFISLGATNGGFEYNDPTQDLRFFTNGLIRMTLSAATGLTVNVAATLAGTLAHTGILAGFFGAVAIARPAVVGSRALGFGVGGAGLSLLAALVALGLVTDATVP